MIHQTIKQFGARLQYVVTSHVIYLKLYGFWSTVIFFEHGQIWYLATAFVSNVATVSAKRYQIMRPSYSNNHLCIFTITIIQFGYCF